MPIDGRAMKRLAVFLAALFLACGHGRAAAAPNEATVLPIAARAQAPESPAAGWCGETAIQEALLHLGVWAPQRLINASGKPAHPDLYSPDIPVALSALGVRYGSYRGPRGFEAFARWVREAIDQGDPVLAGVKILPTAHPQWGLDHFVLVVGHGSRGLLVNTTWGHSAWIGPKTSQGLSLERAFYGLRLRREPGSPRLTVIAETSDAVELRVHCANGERQVTVDARALTRLHCAR